MRIPPDQLKAETLDAIIEECVTRDGTELTDAETKIAEVRRRLERGEAEIFFDEETRTCNIVETRE